MLMFVLHEDVTNFFNFNIENKHFRVEDVIENDRLQGKHKIVYLDLVTVTVQPI
ncbi:hypothetical protein SB773_21810 [Bacillus sp. SIMBA_074]|uniref:hypothetical protein n=1 Tax=Bacillus TaxID=1386 RepID=UPI000278DFA9|nr:hypothetical protein [Bacillus mycoides]EJQ72144.1 hypothetical protein IG7_01931 [Bacillus cereus HuA2-4]QWJ02497.1 hypothetical protein J5V93_09180 [Bacillus mycoides]